MDDLTFATARNFTPLPIDETRGFPQTFPLLFDGRTYHFRLYANIAAARLSGAASVIELPSEDAFLVVQVDVETVGGGRETIFRRKVAPGLEYEFDNIVLVFTEQRVARGNLNGQGEFGSQVVGGIARRWAS